MSSLSRIMASPFPLRTIRILWVPYASFPLRMLASLMRGLSPSHELALIAFLSGVALVCFIVGLWALGVPSLIMAYAVGLILPSRRDSQ